MSDADGGLASISMASSGVVKYEVEIKQEPEYKDFQLDVGSSVDVATASGHGDDDMKVDDMKVKVDDMKVDDGSISTGADEDTTLSALIAENERLQDVFKNLNSRQSVLEEFIEVQYGTQFETFLKNRERLVNVMGLGNDESTERIDGNRSAKSVELVNLLKIVKSRASNHNVLENSNSSLPRSQAEHYNTSGAGPSSASTAGPGGNPPYYNTHPNFKKGKNWPNNRH